MQFIRHLSKYTVAILLNLAFGSGTWMLQGFSVVVDNLSVSIMAQKLLKKGMVLIIDYYQSLCYVFIDG